MESEILKQTLNSIGVNAARFCNLWQIVDTREADMHPFFWCVISDLITTRQFNWTNISKDEKVNKIISFSLFFTARRALFINNNAMIKWHDTQIVVACRTLSAWINWCNLVLFSECLCEEANLNKYICSQVCASNSSSVEWL